MAADAPRKKSAARPVAKKAPETAPVKKAVAKKAPAKKAVAKKAPAKKAVAKKAVAKKAAPPVVPPLVPPAPMEPPEPLPLPAADVLDSGHAEPRSAPTTVPEPTAPTQPLSTATATFVERMLRLDWRQTATIAGPTFLVLFAACCVAATSLLLVPDSFDGPEGGFAGAGGFFHGV